MAREHFIIGLLIVALICGAQGEDANEKAERALNVFNVIKFPNDVCTGSNGLNGTCYTSEECAAKGGSSSGSCASGFGVCCTFSLSCGASATENNTYFVQNTFTTWPGSASPCTYKICPLANVCRIRLDLTAFDIAKPIEKEYGIVTTGSDAGIGKCQLESMTVTAPGMKNPPEICGINTGQHMFIDVTDECVDINIHVNTLDTTLSRTWSIHAKQYTCGDTMAGPTGCLQYHTGLQGDLASFNWDLSGIDNTIFATTTHLANQDYDICFRREENYCRTCFTPKFTNSFGLSTAGTASQSASGVDCDGSTAGRTDYIEIAGAQTGSTNTEFVTKVGTIGWDRMCGVIFNNHGTSAAAAATVCTYNAPFKLHVHFDEGELVDVTPGDTTACEVCPDGPGTPPVPVVTNPSGALGFYLEYFQLSC